MRWLTGSNLYHGITIGNIERGLSITEYYNKNKTVLSAAKLQKNVIVPDAWTEFFITFEEHEINITCNGTQIMHHTQKSPLIVYWFSIGTENGWLTWAANCAPLDIDGPPRDGGWSAWSPWQCTVSCGGGEGVRTRTCSNPRPNIFGEMCEGRLICPSNCLACFTSHTCLCTFSKGYRWIRLLWWPPKVTF